MTVVSKTVRGIVLQSSKRKYLRKRMAEWGPTYVTGPLEEATLFSPYGQWELDHADTYWGGKLRRVEVVEVVTRTVVRTIGEATQEGK